VSDYETRFSGLARLYGTPALLRLRNAHVGVVGLGGVGSWAVEALARSGIGALTLVDLDEVCVSNVNRQLHAFDSAVGRAKAEVMAERIRAINPECRVVPLPVYFTESNADEILASDFDYIVDAIDAVPHKCRLIVGCRERNIPLVVCGAAGGRRDATAIRIADLTKVTHDRLLSEVRRQLRRAHGWSDNWGEFRVDCVFSAESPMFPQPDGTVCGKRAASSDLRLNCDSGFGTASFVTGAFGLAAAGQVVSRIAEAVSD